MLRARSIQGSHIAASKKLSRRSPSSKMSLPLLLDAVCAHAGARCGARSLSVCAELMQSLSVESDFLGMFTGWISLSSLTRSRQPLLEVLILLGGVGGAERGWDERERILTAQKLDLHRRALAKRCKFLRRWKFSLPREEMRWNVKSLDKRFKFWHIFIDFIHQPQPCLKIIGFYFISCVVLCDKVT